MTNDVTTLLKDLPPPLPDVPDRVAAVRLRVRRRRHQTAVTGMLVMAAAGGSAAFLADHVSTGIDRATITSTPTPGERLHPPIDLGSGESFLPPPSGVHPRLSAVAAWRVYARAMQAEINRDHVPRGTYALLGVFIDGGGRQHIAYGYFTPNSAPAYSGPVVPSPPVKCTQWEMLGANTGRHIEGSWLCPPTSFSPVFRRPG